MNPVRDMTAAAVVRAPERPHCAYCDAPLPAATPGHGAHYCCYGCRVLGEAGRKPVALPEAPTASWLRIAVVVVLAGQAMLLGLAVNLAKPDGHARWLLHAALILSSFAALALLGRPLLQSVVEDIRRRRVSIELFFLAGIAGALAASLHSTFTGVGAIYYEVVAVLLTVYSVGRTLGAQSRARALAETHHLVHTFETCQKLGPDGALIPTRVAKILPGDEVRVLPGEPIPVDGRIVRGQAFVCETPLTGEPFPVVRRAGDAVLAGSYSEDGELRIAATVPGHARHLDVLLAALEAAREKPCRIQAQADRLVAWFLPAVLLASAATFAAWTWWSGWPVGLFNALAVLVVACPCAMGLATPVAIWNALAAFAARGLVVRGGDTLERLAGLDCIVFDKTGTLSEERYSLIDLATAGSDGDRVVMGAQLRAVQNASSHPVARAFHSPSATCENAAFRVRSLKTVPALGVEAWLESPGGGESYLRIGQRELLSDLGGEPELLASLRRGPGDPLVYVEVDGRLRAIAAVRERLRDSATDAIAALQPLGVESAVMTGDQPERAAALVGWQDVAGRLTPQDKARRVEVMAEAGRRVAFIGDGVNDAPAINAASVGIALAHGAGVTTAGADAVLYGGDLRTVPWAVALARHVSRSIRSNLVFAACYNVAGIALAAGGLLHPVASALLMVISSFTVSWRALRSTESGDICCTLPEGSQSAAETHRSKWQWFYAVMVVAQIPFLIYLGRLGTTAAVGLSAVMLVLGTGIALFRTRNAELFRFAQMTFAMLGPCNWGMILGWWADAGFRSAVMGCPSCHAAGFSLFGFVQMPWMNAGMLLLGLPPMVLDPASLKRGLNRLGLAVLSAVGMVWGMGFGDFAAARLLGPFVPNLFLLSFAGMTVGMLAGMFLCCELGRSLSLAWRNKKTPHR
jgi:heavy metal translocating P-type ATPase